VQIAHKLCEPADQDVTDSLYGLGSTGPSACPPPRRTSPIEVTVCIVSTSPGRGHAQAVVRLSSSWCSARSAPLAVDVPPHVLF
jgi:hypothetical protein